MSHHLSSSSWDQPNVLYFTSNGAIVTAISRDPVRHGRSATLRQVSSSRRTRGWRCTSVKSFQSDDSSLFHFINSRFAVGWEPWGAHTGHNTLSARCPRAQPFHTHAAPQRCHAHTPAATCPLSCALGACPAMSKTKETSQFMLLWFQLQAFTHALATLAHATHVPLRSSCAIDRAQNLAT